MVALSHAVGRPFAPVFMVRWLERGRQLLVVRMVLPAVEGLAVVLELDIDRAQPPPKLRDVQRVEVFEYVDQKFERAFRDRAALDLGIESDHRPPDAPFLRPARPPLDGLAVPTLEALCTAGPAWSTAGAAARYLPDASELGFAAFCIRSAPSWVTRRFRGTLNQWQMAVEFSPRFRDNLFLPTRIAEAPAPLSQVQHYEELYCMTSFGPTAVPRADQPRSRRHMLREPIPIGGDEEQQRFEFVATSLLRAREMGRFPKRTHEVVGYPDGYRLFRRKPRTNTNLWLYRTNLDEINERIRAEGCPSSSSTLR